MVKVVAQHPASLIQDWSSSFVNAFGNGDV